MTNWRDRLYKILADKSVVDVVRVLHEDEFPLDEIVSLLREAQAEAFEEGKQTAYRGTISFLPNINEKAKEPINPYLASEE